jgi:hypothetical protein
MNYLSFFIYNIKRIPLWKYLFIIGIFVILLINTVHFYYPDEFDNIMGGWFLLKGLPIYKAWFTHHGPVAYIIAASVLLFAGQSFVNFRMLYAFWIGAFMFGGYFLVRDKLRLGERRAYLFFLAFVTIASTYFWGQMLLADTLSAYFIIPVYCLLLFTAFNNRRIKMRDIFWISVLMASACLSSLTYLFLAIIIYVTVLYMYYRENFYGFKNKSTYFPLLILGGPYVLFLLFLIVTGSFQDYYYMNIEFNRASYVYNYPRPAGSTTINPVRFAVVIAHDFALNFHGVITQLTRFNLQYPVNVTFAISNLAFVAYALAHRRYKMALFVIGFMIYSNARSNPLESKETDYQSAVYIVLSIFNGIFVLRKMSDDLNDTVTNQTKKVIFSFLLILVGVLFFYNSFLLGKKFFDKAYGKYMGIESQIYDRPKLAPIINSVVSENDYMWIGPFEFEELFYAKGKFPSKYQIMIPGMRQHPAIIQQIQSDFNTHKPKVIYFDKEYHVLGAEPKDYVPWFLEFLSANYIQLVNYHPNGDSYVSVKSVEPSYDPEAKLYINKDNVDEVLDKLIKANIIKKRSASE